MCFWETERVEDGFEERAVPGCALGFDFENSGWGGVKGGAEAGHVWCVAGIAAGGVDRY